jgi:hypothetical protein
MMRSASEQRASAAALGWPNESPGGVVYVNIFATRRGGVIAKSSNP